MNSLLPIVQLGNPILHKISEEIQDVYSVKGLVPNMIATCEHVGGIGLSAPQIGQLVRLFILSSKPTPAYPDAPYIDSFAIINPRIVWRSDEEVTGWEGCLSIPGIRGLVTRNKSIVAHYIDLNGVEKEEKYEGLLARVFQHEYDHLDGRLFIDRTTTRNLATKLEYERIIAEKP